MRSMFMLLGRICLSLIFLLSAFNKIFNWDASHQYLQAQMSDWIQAAVHFPQIQSIVEQLIPYSSLLLLIATLFEGIGGLSLILDVQARLGAILLVLFLIPATLMMHAFWWVKGQAYELQMIMFLKNLSILGGLFIFLSGEHGASRTSE